LNAVQGHSVDIGGYYSPDAAKLVQAMRPSATFNSIIDALQ
jgi:isocitrate dehydrogenase